MTRGNFQGCREQERAGSEAWGGTDRAEAWREHERSGEIWGGLEGWGWDLERAGGLGLGSGEGCRVGAGIWRGLEGWGWDLEEIGRASCRERVSSPV